MKGPVARAAKKIAYFMRNKNRFGCDGIKSAYSWMRALTLPGIQNPGKL